MVTVNSESSSCSLIVEVSKYIVSLSCNQNCEKGTLERSIYPYRFFLPSSQLRYIFVTVPSFGKKWTFYLQTEIALFTIVNFDFVCSIMPQIMVLWLHRWWWHVQYQWLQLSSLNYLIYICVSQRGRAMLTNKKYFN